MTDLAKAALAWLRLEPAHSDMTFRQAALLGVICDADGPVDFGAVAARLKVTKPVVTRAVARLSKLGMVVQSTLPDDGRRRLISATLKGRDFRGTFKNV